MVTMSPCPAEIAAPGLVLLLNLSAAGGDEPMSRQGPSIPACTASLLATSCLCHPGARSCPGSSQASPAILGKDICWRSWSHVSWCLDPEQHTSAMTAVLWDGWKSAPCIPQDSAKEENRYVLN